MKNIELNTEKSAVENISFKAIPHNMSGTKPIVDKLDDIVFKIVKRTHAIESDGVTIPSRRAKASSRLATWNNGSNC